ncbi:MAG: SPFH domain-containing protein [Microcoleus sp.]
MLDLFKPKSKIKVHVFKQLAAAVAAAVAVGATTSLKASPVLAASDIPPTSQISTQLVAKPGLLSKQQPQTTIAVQTVQMDLFGSIVPIVVGGAIVLCIPLFFGGLVVIGDREVGIVSKKFSFGGKALPPGDLIALNGEAGYQADTLPPGWHWGYWPLQYNVRKESLTVVPQGEIALIIAAGGQSIPPQRILGKVTESDNFQDARKFLKSGGEKGRQLGILTGGSYRINTALFTIITGANAPKHGMTAELLKLYKIAPDKVGIVTTYDGVPIQDGEIAGPIIPNHDNFQNAQKFITGGGRRGLQEQVLLSGSWNLNPWFVGVEQAAMTEIPIGYVGAVISYVGQTSEDVSGAAFTHGNLVNVGNKGVWVTPLYPGKHPLNTRILKVELVPTTNIVLNWSSKTERHSYDSQLSSLTVRSRDGFAFDLEVAQIIHVGALDAPKVISRVGSMQNLVDHVLQPTIGNYFRNSAQAYSVLDFLSARSDRQAEAAEYIKAALRTYDVQAIDTLIGDILPPGELMQTQTDRKIAEEQCKTYEVQQLAQTQRQQLVRETALAEIQQEMVKSEQGVRISELKANSQVKQAQGEAESIRVRGNAQAEAYHAGVVALGGSGYTALQLMQIIGDRHVRVVPDVAVSGNGSGGGLVDGLLGMMMWNQTSKNGENGGELPVAKLPKSEPAVLEPATNLPVAKVPSVKPPKSSTHASVAKSEPDIDSLFDELPFDDRSFS